MTNNTRQITATISWVERKAQTQGHPRYAVTTDAGTWSTAPGAQVAYGISNPEYRGAPVVLTLRGLEIVGVATTDGEHMTGAQA